MLPQHSTSCEYCGKAFQSQPSRRRRFCSHACAYDARTPAPAEALGRKVAYDGSVDGCHSYTGPRVRGYGQITIDGRVHRVHRLAWELAHGPIPDGLAVCHKCDNPVCVRVDHLFLGTNADNIADMVAKGRQARGTTHGSQTHPEAIRRGERATNVAVDAAQVREIRRLHAEEGLTYAAIAARFPVTKSGVSHIVGRRTWQHIP